MICAARSFRACHSAKLPGGCFRLASNDCLKLLTYKTDDQPHGSDVREFHRKNFAKRTPPPIGKRRYHKKWRKGTGFEPSTRLPVCRVSGALSHSATFPRLQNFKDFKTWRPSLDLNQDMKRLPRSRVDFPPPGHASSVHQQFDPRNYRSSRWLMCVSERAIYQIELPADSP